MDKLNLAGQNLGRVFNSRCRHACLCNAITLTKQPNLKLKTWPNQLLGSLPLLSRSLIKNNFDRDIVGARKLTGDNQEVVWAKFSTLGSAVLYECICMTYTGTLSQKLRPKNFFVLFHYFYAPQ
jgi:hypothetical protein